MDEFIAIDFETANPKRVSACAVGYALVSNGNICDSNLHLIKPVGGHAEFQSKIHGIKDEHTQGKPEFDGIFPEIKHIFDYPLVGHSLFDKQVIKALAEHFDLDINYTYIDSASLAKERLPELKNHKLKTLVKHFDLPKFRHHDAKEDAIACANIFLELHKKTASVSHYEIDVKSEFIGLAKGILADDEVNYKEAYQLLYWLEDNSKFAEQNKDIYVATKKALEDDMLDSFESLQIKSLLQGKLLELI